MIIEPFAQNELENNVNPVASTFYAAFTCVPNSLAFNGVMAICSLLLSCDISTNSHLGRV
jgi:hypothetical protein